MNINMNENIENLDRKIKEKIKEDLESDDSNRKISFNQNKITKSDNWKTSIPNELNVLPWMKNYKSEKINREINKLEHYFSKFCSYKKSRILHLESSNPISLIFLLINSFSYAMALDTISRFLLQSSISNDFLAIRSEKLLSYKFFFDQEYFKNNQNIRTIFISINSTLTNQIEEYIKFIEKELSKNKGY